MSYVTVFDQEQYDGDWPPQNLAAAIEWLKGKLEQVPPEYRHKAEVEFDSCGGYYDDHYAVIRIGYWT